MPEHLFFRSTSHSPKDKDQGEGKGREISEEQESGTSMCEILDLEDKHLKVF